MCGPLRGGRIREIECQFPHIIPPMLSTSTKVAKRGAYMQDTMVTVFSHVRQGKILDYMKKIDHDLLQSIGMFLPQ